MNMQNVSNEVEDIGKRMSIYSMLGSVARPQLRENGHPPFEHAVKSSEASF
jgi:hypothetical protein